MVRLEGVRKGYRGGQEVLAGIDLDLEPDVPVAVVGANGTGKSTLLRIIAGCASPTAGRVRGRPAVVGFLPGVPPMPRLSARAYLRHMAALHGASRSRASRIGPRDGMAVLDALTFRGDLAAPVGELSAGNAQKVGLAQALGCRPELLVLDEPWSALDAAASAALGDLLAGQLGSGTALVVADHTGRAAELPGARVVRLAGGELVPEPAAAPDPAAHTLVELRCPGEPAAAMRVLPPAATCRVRDGLLTVRVPADHGDALLGAALAHGCSVLSVRREQAGP